MFSDIIIHNINIKEVYTTNEVAKNYQVTENTVRDHLNNHDDEFIENTHYFYTINPRFRTKILNWTLEGVYMLGFFIKSKQAKIYRKKVAEFLRLCDKARQKKFNEAKATITEQMDEISNLKAIAISKGRHYNDQINGYKSQISRHNTQIATLKRELKKAQKADIFASLDLSEAKFQPFSQHRPSYKELWFELLNILGNRNALKVQNEALRAQNEKLISQNKRLLLILGNINAQTAQL